MWYPKIGLEKLYMMSTRANSKTPELRSKLPKTSKTCLTITCMESLDRRSAWGLPDGSFPV
jgi:hypothetical protein